ncbi:uncharacterized protein EV422DRAFT_518520 [Fimicolochytrium jonesii]|uniref:uncharacterized protein n=1 Tax=Fimicolochytrium jonesii TaxID=1396493 RepID=UPI0022FF1AF7|nr:uncharacterized protein EV422DRAFT_518520 [Fimicolochytrium jonesii]KAI8823980.1 hypothetical protein EV422DRAFT_518520 [Fimicolochytrium jonesii]
MPILPSILLGFLGGQLFTRAIYDHVWYAVGVGADPSTLKSRVTATQRQEALTFYRTLGNQPVNFLYATAAVAALVLLSALLQSIVDSKKRIPSLLSFLTFSGATATYLLKVQPILTHISKLGVRREKADTEAKTLYDLALWQGVVGVAVVVTLLLQAGLAEAESEGVKKVAAKGKEKIKAAKNQ